MSEYAIRIERGGGSRNGEVVAILPTLTDARAFLDDPPAWGGRMTDTPEQMASYYAQRQEKPTGGSLVMEDNPWLVKD